LGLNRELPLGLNGLICLFLKKQSENCADRIERPATKRSEGTCGRKPPDRIEASPGDLILVTWEELQALKSGAVKADQAVVVLNY
jgi:hypothetical protein